MRLRDWKFDAEQYRDIDRAAQAEAEAALAAKKPVYETSRLAGRCANGAERDRGSIWHAVARGSAHAVCGKTYGRHSGGWCEAQNNEAVTCPRCLKKLAAISSGDSHEG